jgi:hypothetical protein
MNSAASAWLSSSAFARLVIAQCAIVAHGHPNNRSQSPIIPHVNWGDNSGIHYDNHDITGPLSRRSGPEHARSALLCDVLLAAAQKGAIIGGIREALGP